MNFQVSTTKMKLLMSSLDLAGLNTKRMSEIKLFSWFNEYMQFKYFQNKYFWCCISMWSFMLENIYISNISFVFKPAESRELIKSFILAVETWKFIEQIKSYSNLNIWRVFGFLNQMSRIQDIRYPTSKSVSHDIVQSSFTYMYRYI